MTNIDRRTHLEVRHGIKGRKQMTVINQDKIQAFEDRLSSMETVLVNHIRWVEGIIDHAMEKPVDPAYAPDELSPSACSDEATPDSEDHPAS